MFSTKAQCKLAFIAAMVIFGTVGIFRRFIDLPSEVVVMFRSLIGLLFLFTALKLQGKSIDLDTVRKNGKMLVLSGVFLGANWTFLFEAYRYASVATATLCYYMAPVFVILASPLFFGESLTSRKIFCAALAVIGMYFVSGLPVTGFNGAGELKGILIGLASAVFYAALMISNKKISGVDAYDKTIVQLGVAAVIVFLYALLRGSFSALHFSTLSVGMLLVVGIVHTGIAYGLYVGAMEKLNAQFIALTSYFDPIVAIFASTFFLHEKLGWYGLVGTVLILGALFLCEFTDRKPGMES